MLVVRVALGLALAYIILVLLGWLFQDRLAFPAPRGPAPDPADLGISHGERMELALGEGTRIVGWYLRPIAAGAGPGVGLLWFYGNMENIGRIWPVLREFQPPGAALLVVDYPGYGASGGSATEGSLYAAADAAYAALARRLGSGSRIFVYGRSLGSAIAVHVAAGNPASGLILESPFTSAREMARRHYPMIPRAFLRLGLDNVATIRNVRCPVLIFHGDADRLVPFAMGRRLAEMARGPVELVTIRGSGHNDTYNIGGREYRDKLWAFITSPPANP